MRNGQTTPEGHAERVLHQGKVLREDAQAFAGEVRQAVDAVQAAIDLPTRMDKNPYATIAVAAGVGYVLGGGLFSAFTGRMLRWGVRLMLVPMLKNELSALGEAALGNAAQSDFSKEE